MEERNLNEKFSHVSVSFLLLYFLFKTSVGAMQWGDVVIFVDGELLSDVERNEAKLPLMVSIIMGLQHSLAMLGGIITPPSLIAGLKEKYHCSLADVKFFLPQISWIFVAISLFFGTLEVSTPHTTQLLKDKEMKLIYWQLFKKYRHVLLFKERFPLFLHSVLKGRLQEMLAFPILKKNFANPGSDSLG